MTTRCTGILLGAPCPWQADTPCPIHTPDRDVTLLSRYGYGAAPAMLRQHLYPDGDLYVVSGSCVMGKRVGDTYYLAGSVMFRPVYVTPTL